MTTSGEYNQRDLAKNLKVYNPGTRENYNNLMKTLEDNGYTWCSGRKISDTTYDFFSKDKVYSVNTHEKTVSWSTQTFVEKYESYWGVKVIPFKKGDSL